ncbi:NUDIX hydrolase [Streptomyces nanshensis]|nr:NUDIX hydrolase [Streptomyces nanshensis]
MTPQEYLRSRHRVWVSAAALLTDALGRVLLVRPAYRDDTWLLPGGGVEAGESPMEGCRRELKEELGLDLHVDDLLALCWKGPKAPEAARLGADFPGSVMSVFDGGTLSEQQVAAIGCPEGEIADFGFFSSTEARERLSPLNRRIMLAALRARFAGTGTAYLEDGRHTGQPPVLDRHRVHVRPRSGRDWSWHPDELPPSHLPIRQAWGWVFVPDGRVLVIIDPHPDPEMRIAMLPGGTVESADDDPVAALVREATEEAQLTLGEPAILGWLHDAAGAVYDQPGPCARLRLAAPVTRIGPAAEDPATGRTCARLLATPEQAAALLGFGDHGYAQAARAAAMATGRWGIPAATPGPVTEVPAGGMAW